MPDHSYGLYYYCAVAGGGLVFLHLILRLMGFRYHPGLGNDRIGPAGADLLQSFVSAYYPLVVAVAVFGGTGLAGVWRRWPAGMVASIALGAGATSLAGGVWLARVLARINAATRAGLARALVGQIGQVAETVPGQQAGKGRVRFERLERVEFYEAVTTQVELSPGAIVKVIGVIPPDTLEVIANADLAAVWDVFTGKGQPKSGSGSQS